MIFETHLIGFPGLGIGPFEINQRAFTFPFINRDVAWYGILITLGIVLAAVYAFWRGTKHNGITFDNMIDIALFSLPSAIIGARLYYVVFNLSNYKSFYDLIAVWEGGLAVYGGIIFGLLSVFLVCRYKKISVMKVFDSIAPAIMLGQIIGRWGNFVNAEAYGGPTSLPWRMSVQNALYDSMPIEVHPTFLYESLWNLAGFIIINVLYKKKKFDGQIFLIYASWYGLGRMFIEGMRTDSLYLGSIRVSQIVGALCFVAGLVLLTIMLKRAKDKRLNDEVYENLYEVNTDIQDKSDENSEKE